MWWCEIHVDDIQLRRVFKLIMAYRYHKRNNEYEPTGWIIIWPDRIVQDFTQIPSRPDFCWTAKFLEWNLHCQIWPDSAGFVSATTWDANEARDSFMWIFPCESLIFIYIYREMSHMWLFWQLLIKSNKPYFTRKKIKYNPDKSLKVDVHLCPL